MRPWWRLFSPAQSLPLEWEWPEELELRIAEREEELERAFRLLHDVYVGEGLIQRQPSEMRILPQQLLPQSSIIIALWKGRIISAASLVRDNPLGLPIEESVSLAKQRQGGRCLAEMSLLALDPHEKDLYFRVGFPMFRFIYQYARKHFNIHTLVMDEVGPSALNFYRDQLGFKRAGFRSKALTLDLLRASENSELDRYLAQEIDHPGHKLPSRPYGIVSDLRLTPQIFERLFLRKAGLLNTLKKEEIRAIQYAYPHPSFESVLKNLNWIPERPLKCEMRLDTQMNARFVEHEKSLSGQVQVRNISRHGLQIWSERAPRLNDVLTIEVHLSDTQSTRVCAQVKWTDASGHSGLRILSYSSEWSVMLQAMEGEFAKLASGE